MPKTTNTDLVVFAVRRIQEANRNVLHMPAVACAASVIQIHGMFPCLEPVLDDVLDEAVRDGRLKRVRCINLDRYEIPEREEERP